MMALGDQKQALLTELLDFNRTATTLGMPQQERQDILGLTAAEYEAWCSGSVASEPPVSPELWRRLQYALPLMRRALSNQAPGINQATGINQAPAQIA